MAGIKESKEFVLFGVALGDALYKSFEDGSIGLSDIFKLVPVFKSAKAALEGLAGVPEELKDLDDAEKEELVAAVKAQFDIADDKMELAIESAFEMAVAAIQLIASFQKKAPVVGA